MKKFLSWVITFLSVVWGINALARLFFGLSGQYSLTGGSPTRQVIMGLIGLVFAWGGWKLGAKLGKPKVLASTEATTGETKTS